MRREGGQRSGPEIQNLLSELSELNERVDEMGNRIGTLEERLPG